MEQEILTHRKMNLPVQEPSRLTSWSVKAGVVIRKGKLLCNYQPVAGGKTMSLKAQQAGKVIELLVQVGSVIQPGSAIMTIDECSHSNSVAHDLCAVCGTDLRKSCGESTQVYMSMIHGAPEIKVGQQEAEFLARRDQLWLLKERKLALIVDLDQTLVHTTSNLDIRKGEILDTHDFTLREHPGVTYYTRLRPHCRKFLDGVSKLYELHIFTMGCRSYADEITRYIDPNKRYFSSRVISRDECIDPTSKALQLRSLFPCGDKMVAIIDDREDIWGGAQNLIRVKPYIFFPRVADINASPSNCNANALADSVTSTSAIPKSVHSLDVKGLNKFMKIDGTGIAETTGSSEVCPDNSRTQSYPVASSESGEEVSVQSDYCDGSRTSVDSNKPNNKTGTCHSRIHRLASGIRDPDDFLLDLRNTLSKIHKMFYAEYDANNAGHQSENTPRSCIHTPDLKEIVCILKSLVLQDCCICFTGVIPTNISPETCPEWKAATSFGATIHTVLVENCVDQVCKPTTHLVVGNVGTSKLHKARTMPGIKIVDCSWLWASVESWQRADEALYPPKESEQLHKEGKYLSRKNIPTSGPRHEGTSSINVSLPTDKEKVDNDSDSSASATEQYTKVDTLEILEGSRKRKLSEAFYSSDEVNSDDDELGALLEAYLS